MNLQALQYLNPASILDIGANAGHWAKEAKLVWPSAYVFMIEANPECEAILKETGIPYTIQLLLDKVRTVNFYQRKCGGPSTGDSVYREDTPWYDDENVVMSQRTSERLDRVCKGVIFDFIKLDCQGAELDILRGGVEVVKNVKSILMEVPVDGVKPYNIGAPTRKEVFDYMVEIGFVNHQVLEDICHPIERHIIQQDILFTR